MNGHSPGKRSFDEDIEMIGMQEIQEAQKPSYPHENGQGPPQYSPVRSNADEDEDDDLGEDDVNRALLSSGVRLPKDLEEVKSSPRIWPQIKGIVIESAPTLLMTTVSLLFTGKLLDRVSRWQAMQEVDQLIMIIPTLLNLNGNLEMNLSARLSTAANIGELDDPAVRRSMIIGSLALLQTQTILISFIAACISLILGTFVPKVDSSVLPLPDPTANTTTAAIRNIVSYSLDFREAAPVGRKSGIPTLIMVACSAMTAASLSGLILGSFMCALVVICRKYDRDPDNIAPAVASCLGDLVTLVLLGLVSTLFVPYLRTPIPAIVGGMVVCLAISCFVYTLKNEKVRPLLKEGWSPLFGAMAISSGTGIVLDMFVSRYEGFAVLAIVISGLPGAAGSILISRLSTSLHAAALTIRQTLPSFSNKPKHPEPSPLLTTITLLCITLPIEVIFLSVLDGLGWLDLPILFVGFSIVFFCCAIFISLLVARYLTQFLWSKNRDPDFYALPIHSALMDLVGQLLLVLCFEIVQGLGGQVGMHAS